MNARRLIRLGVVAVLMLRLGGGSHAIAGPTLTAKDAATHVGEEATVCGVVASTKYSTSTKGEPTFLNLDEPYPAQEFTVLIWGSDRAAFGEPEKVFAHKLVCVSGKIQTFKGKPEIVATSPAQIKVKD